MDLLCQETQTCLQEQAQFDIYETDLLIDHIFDDGGDDYVEILIEKESTVYDLDQCSSFEEWMKFVRLEVISWIFKSRAMFGFRLQTAYLSITYFDRFLSRRGIDRDQIWAVKLLSVACFSLAAKMEEIKVPTLSDFQLEEYNFETKSIQRMELLVLHTLEWRMNYITPLSFVHYFIVKFGYESTSSQHLVSKVVGFILVITKEINLTEHRPSVIAAAAILMSLDQNLTKNALELKMDAISSLKFLEIENVYQCYSLMQKLEMENVKTPKNVNLPEFWQQQLRSMNVIENSSGIGTKRKRLTFNSSDEKDENKAAIE